ncbi:hypothetical protein PMZ80_002333 [Knufia obscura]|uniref:Uncharacterized protein n=1 Tax=Knufia obscura TaxID=1635080 RepID=A0ABR0RYG7_9EURO|nr:hypothetical protein PMZ80_002333 [Knufia obscura]
MHKKLSLCRVVNEFNEIKKARGQAQVAVRGVHNRWMELQESLLQDCHDTSTLPPQPVQVKSTFAIADADHTDEHTRLLYRWRTQLDTIDEKVNNGNLRSAWESIPSLMRAMEDLDISDTTTTWEEDVDFSDEVSSIRGRLWELDSTLCFFLGGQALLSPARLRLNFTQPNSEYTDSKLEVFHQIVEVLEVDVSTEPGVWDFLHLHRSIKDALPVTTLEKVATCTNDKEPVEAQVLKLFSNLLFVVSYCRTATICGHYSEPDCPLPPEDDGPGGIVRDLKLNSPRHKGNECTQAIKHAENAMKAFEALYAIDKEELARSWLLLYGGLTATVLLTIHGLRGKKSDWDTYNEKIGAIHDCFAGLKEVNPALPLLEKANTILSERYFKDSQPSSTSKGKSKPILTRKLSDSSSDDSDEEPRAPKKQAARAEPQSKRKRSIDQLADEGMSSRTRLRRTVKHESRGLETADSSFDGRDLVAEPQGTFGYGNTLQESPYDTSLMPNYGVHPPFTLSAATTFTTNMPQSATMGESTSRNWEWQEDETGYHPWPYGHPPEALPDKPSPSFIPYALAYTCYDELQNRFVPSQQDMAAFSAPMQPPLPSSMQQRLQAEQPPAMTLAESSSFFHVTTAKHFEGGSNEDTTSGFARPRNTNLVRQPSRTATSTRQSTAAGRSWHNGQQQDTAPRHVTGYQSTMLPPEAEPFWSQSGHYDASSQAPYYPMHEQQFHNQHDQTYLAVGHRGPGPNDMHQVPQHHHHHFQNTTTSS